MHSVVKRAFYSELIRFAPSRTPLDPRAKYRIWRDAYFGISPHVVAEFFIQDGLTSRRPPREVAEHMLSEGMRLNAEWLPYHKAQLQAFLQYRAGLLPWDYIRSQAHTLRGGPYWDAIEPYLK